MTNPPPARAFPRFGPLPPVLFLLAFLLASPALAQRVQLVGDGETWSYRKGLSEPPVAGEGDGGEPVLWTELAYDDSSWQRGVPSFGYGDADDVTLLADMRNGYTSVYIRRVFFLSAPAAGAGGEFAFGGSFCGGGAGPAGLDRLVLVVDYDDGFVAYLNGVEVARRGLGSPGTFVPHDRLSTLHEAGSQVLIDISGFLELLRPGRNVLTLQGHNASPGSSDFTLAATLHATGPVEVVRYPYLQRPAPDRVTIAWKTRLPSVGGVLYLPAAASGGFQVALTAAEPGPSTFHAVELTGLAPDTTYAYVVTADGKPLTGGDLLRTLPSPGTGRIEFNAVGDSGVDNGRSRAVRNRWLATGVNLGLRLGDLAYNRGSEEDFEQRYFSVYRDFLRRGFDMTAIGNHEAATAAAQPYLDNLLLPAPAGTERYYSFEAGPALFVSLDVHTSPFGPGSAQHAWLERTLDASERAWKFAFMHNGPYSCSTRHGSNLAARQSFSPLFERYGVDVVFAGHDHGYERSRPVLDFVPDGRPVRYVVSGGGGRSLYPWSTSCPWTAAAESAYQIVKVSVEGPCMSLVSIRPDGSVIDSEATCKDDGAADAAPPVLVTPRGQSPPTLEEERHSPGPGEGVPSGSES